MDAEMSQDTEALLASVVRDSGRSLMAVGALLGVLGVIGVIFPIFSSLTVGVFFGAALAVAGFAHVAHAFSAPGWKGALGELLLALVFLVAGIGLLANPVLALTSLTLLFIAYLVAEGVALLYFAWTLRAERSWVWSVASGALSFLIAGLLWAGFPSTAAWALGLLVGVNLLSTGVSMIVIGYAASKTAETTPPSMAQPGAGV
jgi:uncharacterized membrane protein HdeD (DUF308 family)